MYSYNRNDCLLFSVSSYLSSNMKCPTLIPIAHGVRRWIHQSSEQTAWQADWWKYTGWHKQCAITRWLIWVVSKKKHMFSCIYCTDASIVPYSSKSPPPSWGQKLDNSEVLCKVPHVKNHVPSLSVVFYGSKFGNLLMGKLQLSWHTFIILNVCTSLTNHAKYDNFFLLFY